MDERKRKLKLKIVEKSTIFNLQLKLIINLYERNKSNNKKYVKNSFETVKIEKVYKNIPSQLAKDNKNVYIKI